MLHPGPERDAFIADYAYALEPARDEAPFFFDYFRWRSLGKLRALTPEPTRVERAAAPIAGAIQEWLRAR